MRLTAAGQMRILAAHFETRTNNESIPARDRPRYRPAGL